MKSPAAVAALCLALAGCGSGGHSTSPPPRVQGNVHLSSADFRPGGRIPRGDTCDGAGRRPALRITGVPRAAKALVLIVHDPDAPGRDFTHWTVYDIPPSGKLASGSEGLNELGKTGYIPPCPPKGDKPHRYVLDLYALRAKTGLPGGASPSDVRAATDRLAVGRGELVGTYGR